LALDVNDDASIAAACDVVRQEAGHVDLLVNSAGLSQVGAVVGRRPQSRVPAPPVREQLHRTGCRDRHGAAAAAGCRGPQWQCDAAFAHGGAAHGTRAFRCLRRPDPAAREGNPGAPRRASGMRSRPRSSWRPWCRNCCSHRHRASSGVAGAACGSRCSSACCRRRCWKRRCRGSSGSMRCADRCPSPGWSWLFADLRSPPMKGTCRGFRIGRRKAFASRPSGTSQYGQQQSLGAGAESGHSQS